MDHIFNFSHETFPAVQHSDIIYNALREISSAIFILDKELIPDRWRIKEKNDLTKGFIWQLVYFLSLNWYIILERYTSILSEIHINNNCQ